MCAHTLSSACVRNPTESKGRPTGIQGTTPPESQRRPRRPSVVWSMAQWPSPGRAAAHECGSASLKSILRSPWWETRLRGAAAAEQHIPRASAKRAQSGRLVRARGVAGIQEGVTPTASRTEVQTLPENVTVAILAQGTSWAVAVTQAFLVVGSIPGDCTWGTAQVILASPATPRSPNSLNLF